MESVTDIVIIPKARIEKQMGGFVIRLPERYAKTWERWLRGTVEVWILRRGNYGS